MAKINVILQPKTKSPAINIYVSITASLSIIKTLANTDMRIGTVITRTTQSRKVETLRSPVLKRSLGP